MTKLSMGYTRDLVEQPVLTGVRGKSHIAGQREQAMPAAA